MLRQLKHDFRHILYKNYIIIMNIKLLCIYLNIKSKRKIYEKNVRISLETNSKEKLMLQELKRAFATENYRLY